MAIIHNFLEKYGSSSPAKRVDLILDNYAIFNRMLDGYENDLIIDICEERACARRIQKGDTGVRITTSGISDVTFSTVAERDEVSRAIKACDYFTALKGVNNARVYIRRIDTLNLMRADFKTVSGKIGYLQPDEYLIYTTYLLGVKNNADLADEAGLSYEAYASRIYRYKKRVKELSIEAITSRKCNIMAA